MIRGALIVVAIAIAAALLPWQLASAIETPASTSAPPPTTIPPTSHYSVGTGRMRPGSGGDLFEPNKGQEGSDSAQADGEAQLSAEELARRAELAERAAARLRAVCGVNLPDQQDMADWRAQRADGSELCNPAPPGPPGPGASPAPVAPPSPELIADYLYVLVEGNLPQPQVHSNPEPGVASIIHVPVFVEVTNWVPTYTDSACDRGLCVTVTATPHLTFDPGEEGSSPVTCRGPGDRYDPRRDLDDQTEGACAYSYRKRTGIPGRPKEWPGAAIVTWTLTWTAGTAGNIASGVLPDIVLSAPVPKAVVEVQALLTD